MPPVTITASHKLTDGSTFTFNAAYQRQRPGLIELNLPTGKVVFAGFGSFCDFDSQYSRGWVLGWHAPHLSRSPPINSTTRRPPRTLWRTAIPTRRTRRCSCPRSGCRGSASPAMELPSTSRPEIPTATGLCQAIRAPPARHGPARPMSRRAWLSSRAALLWAAFSRRPRRQIRMSWINGTTDLGSGGVMLFSTGDATYPYLAVAAGKDGRVFLLDPANLGQPTNTSPPTSAPPPLDTQQIDDCWCGPSFFEGSDGVKRVVTSHGSTLGTWQVQMSPSPTLTPEATATINSGQHAGFFTSVSSNGTDAGSAIIWAVGRPTGDGADPTAVTLFAFAATPSSGSTTLTQLFSALAGSWPNTGGDANIVPVVANGKVFVASAYLDASGNTRGQLNIFGKGGKGAPISSAKVATAVARPTSGHVISGTLLAVNGETLTLRARTGQTATVDASPAFQNEKSHRPVEIGDPLYRSRDDFRCERRAHRNRDRPRDALLRLMAARSLKVTSKVSTLAAESRRRTRGAPRRALAWPSRVPRDVRLQEFEEMLEQTGIAIAPFDAQTAQSALDGFCRYGEGEFAPNSQHSCRPKAA